MPFSTLGQVSKDSVDGKINTKIATKWILGKWTQQDTALHKTDHHTLEFKEDSFNVSLFPRTHINPYSFNKHKDSISSEGWAINWPPYYCRLTYVDEKTLRIDYWSFGKEEVISRFYKKEKIIYTD